jgi:Kdo2-lipid IVA lauroyltransferase/acyltransferase
MYYVVYGFLWLVSLLPLPILYLFSDFFHALVYHVFKYRRSVVMNNLALAFPEKTEREHRKIASQFYKNFTDSFIESVKLITAGKRFVEKRSVGDYELINRLADKGYNVNIMAGHQFNWEFANLLYSLNLKIPFVGIYMPISNKALNKIFFDIRKRYGTVLISAQDFRTRMHAVFSSQYLLGLAADQNPGNPSNAFWVEFMGKPAPFVTGPAKGAVRNNAAVVFVGMKKIKRGHYRFDASLIAETSADMTPERLTVLYKSELERTIRQDPPNYLWSHRRWKYAWKPEYGPINY